MPWLVAGDFNEIISNSEKKGGNNRSYAQMQRFREALDACSFMDLGYLGSPFTWQRHFRDGHSVWERLDRALANAGWVLMFGGSKIHHLQCTTSDHSPLWIMPDGIEPPRSTKPFRFEEIWLADKGCSDTVLTEWCREDMDIPGFDVTHKIDRCGKALTFWSRTCFGNVRKDLLNKRKLLARAKFDALFSGVNFRVRELRMEVNDLLDKETRLWLQRSRALWAVHGDKNSKFFHNKATQRHRKNKIEGIKNSTGHWCSRPKDIADCLVDYFKSLFSSSSSCQPTETLSTIQNVVTVDMNSQLNADFMEWEIKLALNQMAPLKAPSPDGMPPLFYQNYWDLIGNDITHAVLLFLNSASLPPHLNHTFITLIPKVSNPEIASDFRPISLCNVLYKIFSKVLANRLKRILPQIITEHQSAFTKNRLISDNILVAFETLHSMKHHNSPNDGFMALKLDLNKAFNRVEWIILQEVMEKMGFSHRWISLIMVCVTTVSYSILVNGEPKGMILPTCGIRQGDPLSPFLFLLCTEGLHGLISNAAHIGDIHGFQLCRRSPKLTHLLFADDSLLFCKSDTVECQRVLDILGVYEKCSGQQINRSKTTIYFNKSTIEERRLAIKELLGVPEIREYERYLGLPSFVGKKKKASFEYIKERVWRKLQGWGEKLLSQAGKEVLIKVVVQAIPTYTMNCFKLPLGLCEEIESMIRKFWWGQRGDRQKIHWVSWGALCKPKSEGGMGFKNLALFNDALLAKQAWRLLHNKDSLFYRIFKSKFFPHGSIMDAPVCSQGSYAWKSLLKGREVLRKGLRWRIGTGDVVNLWSNPWLPSTIQLLIQSPMVHDFANAKVCSVINPSYKSWDAVLLNRPLNHDIHIDIHILMMFIKTSPNTMKFA